MGYPTADCGEPQLGVAGIGNCALRGTKLQLPDGLYFLRLLSAALAGIPQTPQRLYYRKYLFLFTFSKSLFKQPASASETYGNPLVPARG